MPYMIPLTHPEIWVPEQRQWIHSSIEDKGGGEPAGHIGQQANGYTGFLPA